MFLTPARIKDNRVSNFGSKEWMNSKVGLIEVKALVKPQHNNAVNCQASEINPEISVYGDLIATSLLGQPRPFCQWFAAL